MLARVQRFFDIRPGETLPVLLTFFYIAAVIAAFLLAKAIRSGLFLKEYGAYALPYTCTPPCRWRCPRSCPSPRG